MAGGGVRADLTARFIPTPGPSREREGLGVGVNTLLPLRHPSPSHGAAAVVSAAL